MRLLLRDRRTVRLTAAGEIFRREALEISRRNQEAVRLTKRAALGEVGQLRIGFFGSATAAFLPALVQEYHRRFPDVELTLLELTATEQIEAFDRGQLDVGFSRPLPAEPSREFDQELVYTDYLHLVLAPAHSLARNLAAGGTITVKRLSGEKFVLLQRREAIELRLNWRRAPSSPTVEAFRELVQSEREAIRTLMEPRPSEKKQRQGRRP